MKGPASVTAAAADTRAEVLARIRANQPVPMPLPDIPVFERGSGAALEAFAANLARMGGVFADADVTGDLGAFIARTYPDAVVVCSAVSEVDGTRRVEDVRAPSQLDDVDVGVVRALLGVAETGSVLLTEAQLKVNALGFLSQHLLVLLDPAAIVPDLHHAYRHPAFFTSRYAVFLTGPSATADIEGVLVHGAQGVRSLTVVARA
ncbi:MAG TPA: LUD domain-containing protein [Burkholderiaceae bacterium]|nr:LUD domain-containing protein [Burkholderiaceae bacterium]